MKQKFALSGLSCAHCVARVEKAVTELPGVQKVKVNLKKENGVVKFDESQLTPDEIVKKIEDTGYGAKPIA